jgi:hypothetical protein
MIFKWKDDKKCEVRHFFEFSFKIFLVDCFKLKPSEI